MDIKNKKHLGQNFLRDKNVLNDIIQAAEIKPSDPVLEIGPGKGVLTAALLQANAKVTAIEKDPQLVEFLQKHLGNNPNLKIIQGDIRDFLKGENYKKYTLQNPEYKVVGNIPYYLTSYLLRLLLESPQQPSLIVLMIQKEVAQRIIAQPPKMNLLAVSVQYYSKPGIIKIVPSQAFSPQPKVDSAIIKLIPIDTNANLKDLDKTLFFRVVNAGFSHPRKLLLNNLPYNFKIPKIKFQEILEQMNLPLNTRAQNLSLQKWENLTNKIASLFNKNIV